MWEQNVGDFGEEIKPNGTFCFECHSGLSCFGRCCQTRITLTPYDIARLRRHLAIDTEAFLSTYTTSYADKRTGFPFVILRRRDHGRCAFSENGSCRVYESRPTCCRSYPLSRLVDEDGMTGKRRISYCLQKGADYCQGLGQGPEWAIGKYCEANGLGPYDRANDLFFDIIFEFHRLPHTIRYDKDVQRMIYGLVFNFDPFFARYALFPHTALPENDEEAMKRVRLLALNLISRTYLGA